MGGYSKNLFIVQLVPRQLIDKATPTWPLHLTTTAQWTPIIHWCQLQHHRHKYNYSTTTTLQVGGATTTQHWQLQCTGTFSLSGTLQLQHHHHHHNNNYMLVFDHLPPVNGTTTAGQIVHGTSWTRLQHVTQLRLQTDSHHQVCWQCNYSTTTTEDFTAFYHHHWIQLQHHTLFTVLQLQHLLTTGFVRLYRTVPPWGYDYSVCQEPGQAYQRTSRTYNYRQCTCIVHYNYMNLACHHAVSPGLTYAEMRWQTVKPLITTIRESPQYRLAWFDSFH